MHWFLVGSLASKIKGGLLVIFKVFLNDYFKIGHFENDCKNNLNKRGWKNFKIRNFKDPPKIHCPYI